MQHITPACRSKPLPFGTVTPKGGSKFLQITDRKSILKILLLVIIGDFFGGCPFDSGPGKHQYDGPVVPAGIGMTTMIQGSRPMPPKMPS
jgi:hypothetical protein